MTLFSGNQLGLVVGDRVTICEPLPGVLVQFFGQTWLLGWPWKIASWRRRGFNGGVYYVVDATENGFRIL